MDTITAKILVFFLSVFILVIVAHQITLVFDDGYETETAIIYSSAEKVALKGIYVRNETVITNEKNGVLSYPNVDGSKIAKDSVVAYVYRTENDIFVNQQIEKLKEEAELLEKEQSPGTTDVVELEFISKLIEEKYQTITAMIAKNDLEGLAEERKNFQSLLGIYQIVINEETDYNDRIDRLHDRINELEKKKTDPIDAVTVSDSGYFISHVDGYEGELKPDKLNEIDIDDLKEIIENNGYNSGLVSKRAVGKLVDGYEWKLIGIVNENTADFRTGSNVSVKLSSTPDTVTAVIEDIIKTDNEDESIIILSCEKLNYNLVQNRIELIEIILTDYNGIRIPRDAIRFNKENEKGVYILLGQKIAFRKIDVIYECEEYLLSKITSDTSYVSVYDDIITEGIIPLEMVEYTEETSVTESVTGASQSSTLVIGEQTSAAVTEETDASSTDNTEVDENV